MLLCIATTEVWGAIVRVCLCTVILVSTYNFYLLCRFYNVCLNEVQQRAIKVHKESNILERQRRNEQMMLYSMPTNL